MQTGIEVFEAYQKLSFKEKIRFTRAMKHQDDEDAKALQQERLEIACSLENAGINSEWLMKNILNF